MDDRQRLCRSNASRILDVLLYNHIDFNIIIYQCTYNLTELIF